MRHGGFVLIMILAAIAILAMLYFVDVRTVFHSNGPATPQSHWLDGGQLITKGKIPRPRPPRPPLDQFANQTASIRQFNDERGTLEISVSEDGRVSSTWNTNYKVGDIEYRVNASTEGNVDISRTFEGQPEWLMIVGEGRFTKQGYNSRTSRGESAEGRAFLSGWLKPDGHGEGKFYLVENSNSYETFEWNF